MPLPNFCVIVPEIKISNVFFQRLLRDCECLQEKDSEEGVCSVLRSVIDEFRVCYLRKDKERIFVILELYFEVGCV